MARYNTVQIESIYLTQNGLVGGKPCKVNVQGINLLKTTKTGQVLNSANGTPYAQLIDLAQKGIPIVLTSDWMSKSVFDSIVAEHESAKNSGTSISLDISGDTGNFSLDVIPMLPDDVAFEGFSNSIIKNVVFKYMTT